MPFIFSKPCGGWNAATASSRAWENRPGWPMIRSGWHRSRRWLLRRPPWQRLIRAMNTARLASASTFWGCSGHTGHCRSIWPSMPGIGCV